MPALGTSALTLADWAKRLDPDGKVPKIVEMLSQTNEVLSDMLWIEGNLPTGHRSTIRTGLPTVYWRLLNQGTTPSKSTTAQVDEACAKMDAWSEVDKDLADLSGNSGAFRLSESQAFIEAMNQEFVSTLFYGNAGTAPEEFTGLAARYSSLSAANAQNIVSGSGAGSDNSSIWLIVWGDHSCHGVFPKGSTAGLKHVDHGEGIVETTAGVGGSRMVAYRDQYKWDCGLVLRDWRYVVRIPNIDISNLVGETSSADLQKLMIKAIHRIPSFGMGKAAFYMNRSCHQMLDIQSRDSVTAGGGLSYQNVGGMPVLSFRGIPVRKVDALTETESVVS